MPTTVKQPSEIHNLSQTKRVGFNHLNEVQIGLLRMFSRPMTEEQTLKRTEEENNRMKQLNDKFGIEFTPELREKLKEIL